MKQRIKTVGHLRRWLERQIRDGNLTDRSEISMPDLEGCGRDRAVLMLTLVGSNADWRGREDERPYLMQMWGVER